MRTKHTFVFPRISPAKLADYAARKRVPQALVVEAALASHLSPDGADRLEAALARRLDRMTRQMERIERHVTISNEALAVFVRFWLTSTPALPDTALAAAQTKGRERYDGSSKRSAGGWRAGRKLADEVSQDVASESEQRRNAERHLTADPPGRLSFYPRALPPHHRCCGVPFPALSNQPR